MTSWLQNVAAVWNLILLCVVFGTLAGFVYWFFLRRIWRARNIRAARMKRLMREAAERDRRD